MSVRYVVPLTEPEGTHHWVVDDTAGTVVQVTRSGAYKSSMATYPAWCAALQKTPPSSPFGDLVLVSISPPPGAPQAPKGAK